VTPPIFTLKARAEQMRRDGVPVHEVARAVGRSSSTIYGWAAQGGWRVEDLEGEVGALDASSSGRAKRGTGGPRDCPGKPDEDAGLNAGGETPQTPAPLSPLEAAKALHQRSADLAAAGQIRPAEAAARLADRILRTEYLLGRVGGAAAPEQPEADAEDIRAKLAHRFHRISKHYHQLKADGDPHPEQCLPKAVYFMAERNNCSVEKFLAVFLHPPEM